jgi:hypothetical protein
MSFNELTKPTLIKYKYACPTLFDALQLDDFAENFDELIQFLRAIKFL